MIFRHERGGALALVLLASLAACSGGGDTAATREATAADTIDAWRARGQKLLAAGELPQAGRAFDRALQESPNDPGLWTDIARLRYRGGQHEQALEAVDRALSIDPKDAGALLFRGQIARDSQGLKAGRAWLARGTSAHPDDPALLADHAATLIDLGRASEGLAMVRQLAQADPEAPEVGYLQAVIAARGGNFPLANALIQRLPPEMRRRPATMMLDGIVALEQGRYAGAAQTFDALARLQPDNRRVDRLLARALLLGGNWRELVARFGPDGRAADASPYVRTMVGRAEESLDRRGRAAASLDAAASGRVAGLRPMAPTELAPVAQIERAITGKAARDFIRENLATGQVDQALARARQFAAATPGSADASSLLGDALLRSGDPNAALQAYRRAARIRQGWPLTRRMIAAERAADRPQAAERVLARYLRGGGDEVAAVAMYAQMRADRGAIGEAALLFDLALANGGENDPASLARSSQLAAALGDVDSARDLAWRAYSLQPMYAPAIRAVARTTDDPALRQRMEAKLVMLAR